MLPRLAPASRVLELGCGDGTTARLLADAGHRVHGIDSSPAFIALARERAPAASLHVGSFVDAPLPRDCDAVLAVGEVLGYEGADLGAVLDRVAKALRTGGLLLFDLAAPGRAPAGGERVWTEGEGWAVLAAITVQGAQLTREIVTYRDLGAGSFRRSQETHRLRLHRPGAVLAALRAAGCSARTLPGGYAGEAMPRGLVAYLAQKR